MDNKKEPYATKEEFSERVTHYPDVPQVQLNPGSMSHVVSTDKVMLSFLTQEANAYFPPHRHEAEQIMIVIDGGQDEIVEGKLYPLHKGDVIVLPSNVEHGGYIHDTGCVAIDIFIPPRADLLEKVKAALGEKAT